MHSNPEPVSRLIGIGPWDADALAEQVERSFGRRHKATANVAALRRRRHELIRVRPWKSRGTTNSFRRSIAAQVIDHRRSPHVCRGLTVDRGIGSFWARFVNTKEYCTGW